MTIEEEIKRDIHGEEILNLACDFTHEMPISVGTESVLMDVIKVENCRILRIW